MGVPRELPREPRGAPRGSMGAQGCRRRPTEPKTLIFLRFFKGWSKNARKTIGFVLFGGQARPPRADFLKRLRAESGVRNSPADPPDPADPAKPAKVVSGAAVQTLPNHAQESQDDVSSQANSLK